MTRRTLSRSAVVVGACALAIPLIAAAAGTANAASTSPGRITLAGSQPAPIRQQPLGTLNAQQVTFNVVLPLRHAAAAESYATSVADPKSANYHRYLTPARFNATYAPSASSVTAVKKFLASRHLRPTAVAEGNRWVTATGTASAVGKAFDTQLKSYSVNGRALHAPDSALSVPASLAPDISGVAGLDTTALAHTNTVRPAPGAAAKAGAQVLPKPSKCSSFWAQHAQSVPPAYGGQDSYPTYICGYVPDQLQSAYGVKNAIVNGRTGKHVTVAIVDAYASPTMKADANQYSTNQGLPTFTKDQYTEKVFRPFNEQIACGGEAGWNGEETLDVEGVHSIAPGANILYVGGQNCDQGLDVATNYIVQHHAADIVSNSYGFGGEDVPASELSLEHSIFVQAAAEGIGFYFSSGDSGDNLSSGLPAGPDYPASDPMVTGVGGTSIAIDANNSYLWETGWGSSLDRVSADDASYTDPLPGAFYAGAGGGTSGMFKQPAYQRGVVPDTLARRYGGPASRVVPDVALDADPYTGFLIGETVGGVYMESDIGGTSLATPLFAGVQALASQGLHCSIGRANPVLYSLSRSAFKDTTPKRISPAVANPSGSYLLTFDHDSSLQTEPGYDDVTGLGSPNGARFINQERRAAS